jgi:hypothetical protein
MDVSTAFCSNVRVARSTSARRSSPSSCSIRSVLRRTQARTRDARQGQRRAAAARTLHAHGWPVRAAQSRCVGASARRVRRRRVAGSRAKPAVPQPLARTHSLVSTASRSSGLSEARQSPGAAMFVARRRLRGALARCELAASRMRRVRRQRRVGRRVARPPLLLVLLRDAAG